MEQNHYNDEFEKMLRENTEDFRMYPSKKVWHSIYNDLHPDRKWPSLAVCLVLLTAILHVGVSNNNTISKNAPNLLTATLSEKDVANSTDIESSGSKQNNRTIAIFNGYKNRAVLADNIAKEKAHDVTPSSNLAGNSIVKVRNSDLAIVPTIYLNKHSGLREELSFVEPKNDNIKELSSGLVPGNRIFVSPSELNENTEETSIANLSSKTDDRVSLKGNNQSYILNSQDKAWIDNYAFYNKKNRDKWKAKLAVQYYITPSVGYRELYKNNDFEPTQGFLVRSSSSDDDVTHIAGANLEGGASLLLKINKKFRVKAGLQLNLTNYVTYAHKLEHPTQTTILLNDANNFISPVSYSTNYGNIAGSNLDRLNNKTAQISLPIGVDFKLMGNDKIKWYIGATIQPTRLIGGEAYLISSDVKNFASDRSMLRKWNVNSSVETFISYKMPSGLHITLGPQIRYQLLSTYKKQYTYTEKLYNAGLKIGLSTNF